MSKHGLIYFVAIVSATRAALAADVGGNASIPNFATDSGTGWRIDRTVGVDDLLGTGAHYLRESAPLRALCGRC